MPLDRLEDIPSLSERAYQTVREAILSLEIEPGAYLSIQGLSEQLGVSRTPVRDALLRLSQEELVSIVPYKGAYVSSTSAQDVEEIMELRALLEGYAVKQIAKLLSPKEIAEAESILERAERAYAAGQTTEATVIGQEFHDLLLGKVRSRWLLNFIHQLDVHYARVRASPAGMPGRLAKSIEEHRSILRALKAGDAEAASEAIAAHISSGRDAILSVLSLEQEELIPRSEGESSGTKIR